MIKINIKMKCLLIIALLFISCNDKDNILIPQQDTRTNWVEIIRIDSTGKEDSAGKYLIKNKLELFDSTYRFSTHQISEYDSTVIYDTLFTRIIEGMYKILNDKYLLYSSNRHNLSEFKMLITNNTLWLGAIAECTLASDSSTYFCRMPADGSYLVPFIWDHFYNKKTATFIKCF
ncbi:MAG TPA: hypothetical protein VJ954_10080 [Ignavibacteriaceae bacterium]|nr:hypothetical protein [Ignavibacteriaceae bacterium]